MRSNFRLIEGAAMQAGFEVASFVSNMAAAGAASTAEAVLRAAMRQNALTMHHYRSFHRRHERFMRSMFEAQNLSALHTRRRLNPF